MFNLDRIESIIRCIDRHHFSDAIELVQCETLYLPSSVEFRFESASLDSFRFPCPMVLSRSHPTVIDLLLSLSTGLFLCTVHHRQLPSRMTYVGQDLVSQTIRLVDDLSSSTFGRSRREIEQQMQSVLLL